MIGALMALKVFVGSRKSNKPATEELPHGIENDGPFYVFDTMRRAISKDVKIMAYPILRKLGISIDVYYVNDPDECRKIFNKYDTINGHEEMFGWYDLNIQYRKLIKAKNHELIFPRKNGLIRDFNPEDPVGTKTGKLCRKRLLEVLSKKSLEARLVEIINSERDHMVAKIQKLGKNGTVAFQSFDTVVSCGLNVILQFALGIDLSDDPERLSRLNELINVGNHSVNNLDTYKLFFMSIPYSIRNWIPLKFWPKFVISNNEAYDEMIDMVEQHNKNWQPGDPSSTFISILGEDKHSGKITYSDVIHSLQALLFAGADTVGFSVSNMLVNLARFPEIQEKCYKALSDVSFRCDSLNDCPYFLAAVWESYRYSTSIYRSLIHSVTQDTKINGMTFKKDDLMAASLMGIHMSEKYFPEAYKFSPERYIVDGEFRKHENVIPFNVGKRACPGQILANVEVFHFVKNILETYEVKLDPRLKTKSEPTAESYDSWWSKGRHSQPMHQFVNYKDDHEKLLFILRK